MTQETDHLEDLLTKLDATARREDDRVSVEEIVETVGKRSFGPALLLCGLLGMTPVSAIPTAPSLIALITILIAGQLVFGRETIWLPRWLLRLSVKPQSVRKSVKLAQRPARFADRIARPRLQALTKPVADRLAALVCVLIALAVPPLELLPFAAFVPSLAIFTFGLGLIARDGLIVLIAFLISLTVIGLLATKLLG